MSTHGNAGQDPALMRRALALALSLPARDAFDTGDVETATESLVYDLYVNPKRYAIPAPAPR